MGCIYYYPARILMYLLCVLLAGLGAFDVVDGILLMNEIEAVTFGAMFEMFAGLPLIAMSLIGIYATYMEKYRIELAVAVALGISGFIAFCWGIYELASFTEEKSYESLKSMYKNRHESINTAIINRLQIDRKCCGLRGPSGKEVTEGDGTIMKSCCSSKPCTKTNAYSTDCATPYHSQKIIKKSVYLFQAWVMTVIASVSGHLAFAIKWRGLDDIS